MEYSRFGWSAFTMDGVARKAGVGKAALYRRWPDKASLLLDALEARSAIISTISVTGDLLADLTSLGAALLEHFLDPYGWATLRAAVDAASDTPSVAGFHDRLVATHREAATDLFERYVVAGDLSSVVSADVMAEQFFGAVLMHVLALPPEERARVRAASRHVAGPIVDLFLAGARTR
ncbi:TetR/AcrR family transcriptional regulator [Gordonia sp. HY366]|uniref:TetR/AcrR family transcriptional regulator n=1 Tax=Gordonia liuliyuniae TaxID=2911517 RepID=A0ABS9IP15_9ACTN|nr:TetR/AcrR family transcriptional regulator [Gordonia liuliyuniae]